MMKRLTALLLALSMVLFAFGALAQGDVPAQTEPVVTQETAPAGTEEAAAPTLYTPVIPGTSAMYGITAAQQATGKALQSTTGMRIDNMLLQIAAGIDPAAEGNELYAAILSIVNQLKFVSTVSNGGVHLSLMAGDAEVATGDLLLDTTKITAATTLVPNYYFNLDFGALMSAYQPAEQEASPLDSLTEEQQTALIAALTSGDAEALAAMGLNQEQLMALTQLLGGLTQSQESNPMVAAQQIGMSVVSYLNAVKALMVNDSTMTVQSAPVSLDGVEYLQKISYSVRVSQIEAMVNKIIEALSADEALLNNLVTVVGAQGQAITAEQLKAELGKALDNVRKNPAPSDYEVVAFNVYRSETAFSMQLKINLNEGSGVYVYFTQQAEPAADKAVVNSGLVVAPYQCEQVVPDAAEEAADDTKTELATEAAETETADTAVTADQTAPEAAEPVKAVVVPRTIDELHAGLTAPEAGLYSTTVVVSLQDSIAQSEEAVTGNIVINMPQPLFAINFSNASTWSQADVKGLETYEITMAGIYPLLSIGSEYTLADPAAAPDLSGRTEIALTKDGIDEKTIQAVALDAVNYGATTALITLIDAMPDEALAILQYIVAQSSGAMFK